MIDFSIDFLLILGASWLPTWFILAAKTRHWVPLGCQLGSSWRPRRARTAPGTLQEASKIEEKRSSEAKTVPRSTWARFGLDFSWFWARFWMDFGWIFDTHTYVHIHMQIHRHIRTHIRIHIHNMPPRRFKMQPRRKRQTSSRLRQTSSGIKLNEFGN